MLDGIRESDRSADVVPDQRHGAEIEMPDQRRESPSVVGWPIWRALGLLGKTKPKVIRRDHAMRA
jgi:hypothetical protein